MKEVKLVSMQIENFKGIKFLEAEFGTETKVSGANGTGKTSLYEAYMWCLFEKRADGSTIDVQPVDEHGNVIHHIETAVEVALRVNGDDLVVKRVLYEDWVKPRGMQEEVLKGRKNKLFWNGSPVQAGEFCTRLDEICKREDWYMLSTIKAFMGMKMEDRRAKLQSIAKIQTDEEIAADYPHVLEALKKGKPVSDLLKQVKADIAKIKTELADIPVRLSQLDTLRVDYDFEELDKEAEKLKAKIAAANDTLSATVSEADIDRAASLKAELESINNDLADIEREVDQARQKRLSEYDEKISKCNAAIAGYRASIQEIDDRIERNQKLLEQKKQQFEQKKTEWMAENAKQYVDTVADVCPTCKRPLPADEVFAARETAIQEFNKRHNELLDSLLADAERINKDIKELEASIQKDKDERGKLDQKRRSEESILTSADTAKKNVPSRELTLSAKVEYQNLLTRKGDINVKIRTASAPTASDTAKEEKKKSIINQRTQDQAALEEIHKKLGQRDTNANIDKKKGEIEDSKKEMSQRLAELENIEFEIGEFKKRKITIVEDAVSSFFKIVRWKMYAPNISNDGEKELCDAIVDSKPYGEQNLAMQMNGGVDIINGISEALGVRLPLFIDQKESVTSLIETNTQLITLEVSPGSELSIQIIKK